jgi:nucleoside-diphosphate-sugar epimerase
VYDGPVIFTSTCSVYGHCDGLATETSPVQPLSVYAQSKLNAEAALLRQGRALILRLGTLHGVSARMRFDLVVNAMTRSAVTTGRVHLYGGDQRRPLLAVQDAARFIAARTDGDWVPGVYNLATENLHIRDVAQAVLDELPGTALDVVGGDVEDRRDYAVDTSKVAPLLDFQPAHAVDSVRAITAVLREGRIKDPGAARYANRGVH